MTRIDWEKVRQRLKRVQEETEEAALAESRREMLYRQRAQALAQAPASTPAVEMSEIIVFRLGEDRYALPIDDILEVCSQPRLAATPTMPAAVAGLLQVRGEVYVVWDLSRLLGGAGADRSATLNVLLLRGDLKRSGLLIGTIEDIRTDEGRDSPSGVPQKTPFAVRMTSDFVTVLNTESLFAR